MPQCPSCQSEINLNKDDFGMIPCASCGVMIFVDMDGEVQVYEETETETETETDEPTSGELFAVDTLETNSTDSEPANGDEFASLEPILETDDQELEVDFATSGEADQNVEFAVDDTDLETSELEVIEIDPVEEKSEQSLDSSELNMENEPLSDEYNMELPEQTGEAEEDIYSDNDEATEQDQAVVLEESGEEEYDFDSPLVDETADSGVDEYEASPNPLGEIQAFGNEQIQNVGPLTYDVKIEGIDTAEMRTWIRDSLDDERFLWSVGEIMQAIESGELILHDLNPVKASVVVNRLKTLKVRITWRQSALAAD